MTSAMLAAAAAAVCVALATAQLDRVQGLEAALRRRGRQDASPGMTGAHQTAAADASRVLRGGGPARDLLAAAVCACAALAMLGPVPAVVLGAGGAGASAWFRIRARAREAAERERGMPALARSLADALRGGASVRASIDAAADDRSIPRALREEISEVARSVRLGVPLDPALAALAERGGPGLRLLCGSIAMHLEAGGALAGEIVRLAADGEAAARIEEERVAATAQARATVRVVAALPVLALLGAEVATGNFIGTIAANPLALALLLLGFGLEAAAILSARAIVGTR